MAVLRSYDRAEIAELWEKYTKEIGTEYPFTEESLDSICDLVEQSRWEVEKGRMQRMLTIEEAVQIVHDMQ